jgi:hypothetical protein
MNSAVEDNARLANFIFNLDRTGDAARAAEHTKKFLFDYADLTAFEQKKLKKLIPFYTFMRKNTPLQVEQLVQQPGKISLRLQAGDAVTEELPEGAPSYMERTGAKGLPGQIAGLLGQAGKSVVLTPDTPLSAAMGTIDPFAKLSAAIPAILSGDAPESLPAEVWRPLVSMLGGARGTAVKVATGEASSKDLFSGAELPPGDLRDRLIRQLLPAVPRLQGIKPKEAESLQQFLLRQAGIRTQTLK